MERICASSGCEGSFPEIVITVVVLAGLAFVAWMKIDEWRHERSRRNKDD